MNEGKAAWYALLNLSWLNLHFTSLKIYLAVNNNGNLIQKVNNYDDLKNLFWYDQGCEVFSISNQITESKFFDYQFCGITNIGFKIEKIEKIEKP